MRSGRASSTNCRTVRQPSRGPSAPSARADVIAAEQAVAVVTAYFWPERLGCAPYMTDLANHLARHGHVVDVFTAQPHYPRKDRRLAADAEREGALDGLRIHRARILDRSSGGLGIRVLNDVLFALQTAVSVATAGRDGKTFLVLVPTVLAVPALRLIRPRGHIIAAVYDIESGLARATGLVRRPFAVRLLDSVERWCLNRADAVLVLTPQMRTALAAIGVARPLHVLPIWPLVGPLLESPARDAGDPTRTLMYSGGLTRRHGAHLLAPLWHHLARQMPDCRLIVQGDGAERDSILRELCAAGGHVTVRPTVDRQALASSLAEADLQLVLQAGPAAAFAMPSKALTCLAAGVPFLTNAPVGSALADFATASGGGLVVPEGEASSLSLAAASLLSRPQELRAMAARGLAYVRHHHHPAHVLRRYDVLLFASMQVETMDGAPPLASRTRGEP
jgi:colanic acid biosynthesis glycosyl transferase WcaI